MLAMLISLIAVGAALWTWNDAAGRDWTGRRFGQIEWTIVVGFAWIVTLPLYVVRRPPRLAT